MDRFESPKWACLCLCLWGAGPVLGLYCDCTGKSVPGCCRGTHGLSFCTSVPQVVNLSICLGVGCPCDGGCLGLYVDEYRSSKPTMARWGPFSKFCWWLSPLGPLMDRQTNYKDMSPLGYQFLLDFCPLVLYVYSKGTGNEIFSDFFFMNVLVMTIGHQSVCLSWFYLPIWPRSCRALPLSTVCLQQRYQECNFFSIFVHIYLNYDHWSSVCLSILVLPPHMV